MKVTYAISRWNNANRARARHIPNDTDERPLCWTPGAFKNVFSWEQEEGDPTCTKCIRIATKQQALDAAHENLKEQGQPEYDTRWTGYDG